MKTYGLIFTNDDPSAAPAVSLAPTLTTFFQIGGTTLTPPGITKPISTLGLYTFEWSPTLPIYFLADGGTLVTDTTQRYLSGILDPLDNVNEQSTTLLAYSSTLVAIGTTNIALGTTNVALGITNIALGTTNVALGSTNFALNSIGNSLITSDINLGTSILAQGLTTLGYGVSTYAVATTILAGLSNIVVSVSLSSSVIDEINLKLGATTSAFGDSALDPGSVFGYLKRLQEFNEGDAIFSKSTGVWTITDRTGATTIATKTLSNNNTQVTKT